MKEGVPDSGRPAADSKQAAGEQVSAWLEALEAGRLTPPRDPHDRAPWDRYWRNHLKVGTLEQAFSDWLSSDSKLPALLTRRGARTILCAGNGLSAEALSLAMFGFHVIALDISAVPAEAFRRMLRNPEHPARRVPGFDMRDDDAVTFTGSSPIDPELCPHIHRGADQVPTSGGSLSFVTGNLMTPEVCPGPFDVVIERRTVQLFPEDQQTPAIERLVACLAERGTLLSHQHRGAWRPGDDLTHHAESWVTSHGFVVWSGADGDQRESVPRLAYLKLSTG